MRKKLTALGILFSMAVLLCGCAKKEGASEKLTEITMVLDWTPNTNHTGF